MPYADKQRQREYQAAWFQKNKKYLSESRKKARHKYRKRSSAFVQRVKKFLGCKDCGIKNPVVLDFDHLPQYKKLFSIGRSSGVSIKKLKEEMRKCEVVCANCHRIRTFERESWQSGNAVAC